IYIPRISYSQYKLLKNSSLLKIPELEEDDFIDPIKLKSRLKRGDLLFWTNTHDEIPEYRDPPISHVMIFVGVSKAGNFLMVGAGTKGVGETTTGGGVDLYIFEPNQVMGCVKNETGECKINSKFVGFGRFYLKKNKSAIKYLLNLKE
ncbi:MAG: hypothetical protein KDK36_21345, partial [Leptospiraceae bacterium]|nr:hypothetical protein [Leptospiraceae bacterium]